MKSPRMERRRIANLGDMGTVVVGGTAPNTAAFFVANVATGTMEDMEDMVVDIKSFLQKDVSAAW